MTAVDPAPSGQTGLPKCGEGTQTCNYHASLTRLYNREALPPLLPPLPPQPVYRRELSPSVPHPLQT